MSKSEIAGFTIQTAGFSTLIEGAWTNSAWIASPDDQKAASRFYQILRQRFSHMVSDASDIRIRIESDHLPAVAKKRSSGRGFWEFRHFRAPCAPQWCRRKAQNGDGPNKLEWSFGWLPQPWEPIQYIPILACTSICSKLWISQFLFWFKPHSAPPFGYVMYVMVFHGLVHQLVSTKSKH